VSVTIAVTDVTDRDIEFEQAYSNGAENTTTGGDRGSEEETVGANNSPTQQMAPGDSTGRGGEGRRALPGGDCGLDRWPDRG
jgi:hypothetical protein